MLTLKLCRLHGLCGSNSILVNLGQRHIAHGHIHGALKVPAGVLIDARDITSLPPHERVLMVTGSQGEPMAALSRMAHSEHR
ncbi:MAG: hypothetical protein ACFNL5_07165, partial [Rothia dentocariosa]